MGRQEQETKKLPAYLVTIAVNIFTFSSGVCYGWTSSALPRMNGLVDPGNNPLSEKITPEEESWVAALLSLGSAVGTLILGPLSDKVGRKGALILGMIPLGLSFVILAFADKVYLLYIGRLIGGFGTGAGFTIVPMYIGEIAEDRIRGGLGCFMPLFLTFGLLFTYSLGPYITVKWFCLINVIPPLMFIIFAFLFIPESPYYYIAKDRRREAEIALCKLRGTLNPSVISNEMIVFERNVIESFSNKGSFMQLFKEKGLKIGIILSGGVMFFQQFSGVTPVLSYMQLMFEEANTSFPSEVPVIIVGAVICLCCAVTVLFIDKIGRRFLLLVSLAMMGMSNLGMAIFFILKKYDIDVTQITWIPIVSLMTFMAGYYFGIGPIPWVLIGELFPPKMKAAAATISCIICLLGAFIVTVSYPYLASYIGIGESFFIFAIFCFSGCIFVYLFLPETKGRSLREIQQILSK